MTNFDSRPVSRRTVAKGAAWATPVIAMASAAPAYAASLLTVVCPDPAKVMTLQGGSAISVSSQLAGNGSEGGGTGTYYSLSLGQWNVNSAQTTSGQTITGYYLDWGTSKTGDNTSNNCTDWNGTSPVGGLSPTNGAGTRYKGHISLATPTSCSPQVAGAGLAVNVGIQTNIPYGLDACSPARNLGCVSLPFTVQYLDGLTPVAANSCAYYFNVCFRTGCQPNYATSWSISTAPLY